MTIDTQPTLFTLPPVVAVQHADDDDLDTRFARLSAQRKARGLTWADLLTTLETQCHETT